MSRQTHLLPVRIKKVIMAKRPGRVTIVDVARAAGISVTSASVALRGEPGVSAPTRDRVQATAHRLGYQPDQRARVLREQRSRLLGVTFAVDHAFDSALVENLYLAAADTEYDLVLSASTANRPDAEAVASLLRDRCPTLLLISPAISPAQLVELTERAAVVVIGSDLRADRVDTVHSDDLQGVAVAVDHLVELGHRSITYVDGGTAVLSAARRDGYRAAMAARGLGARSTVISGAPTEEAGISAARRMLDGDELPTAVLTHNDQMALGLLLTLRQHGVDVPGQLSIVGYDDTPMAALTMVRLTSVSQDVQQLARAAITRAIVRTEDPGAPAEDFVAAPRLVVRDTTGPRRG
jgi:DNA-binding LacI/PurR family transcriptional regulator